MKSYLTKKEIIDDLKLKWNLPKPTDEEIKYYSKLWSFLNIRHANNPFFSKLYNQMTTKKSLTQNQWSELEYLLKNGRSKYEAGILPRNN